MENTSNEENVRSCYIWNHWINDLLSHYYFAILILDCEIYRTALSVHRIDHIRSSRKTRTTRMKPFKSFMWPTKISVARKSSVLYRSSLKNAKKYRLLPWHILRASSWTYLVNWRRNGITSAFTDILLSLLLFSSGTIIPQCCLRGSCLKRYTPDIISCMNVSKDIQCSSISERHRYKVLSDSESKGNMKGNIKLYFPDIIRCMNVSKDPKCSSISKRHQF